MINKVILVGNVGADPEIHSLESGVKTARIRLATTERYFDRQANMARELTEWHTVVAWRGLAYVVDKYVRKGSQIYIEGSLHTREWTDREGQKRFSTEITAAELKLLGRRAEAGQSPAAEGGQTMATPVAAQPMAQPIAQPAMQPAAQPANFAVPADAADDLPF